MSAPIRYVQAEVEDPLDGGLTMMWLRADKLRALPDVRTVYSRTVLTACRSCGRKCSPDAIRCHCGERP